MVNFFLLDSLKRGSKYTIKEKLMAQGPPLSTVELTPDYCHVINISDQFLELTVLNDEIVLWNLANQALGSLLWCILNFVSSHRSIVQIFPHYQGHLCIMHSRGTENAIQLSDVHFSVSLEELYSARAKRGPWLLTVEIEKRMVDGNSNK